MSKIFIDTNILIYSVHKFEKQKNIIAISLLKETNNKLFISTQNINEFIAAVLKKNILSEQGAFVYAKEFLNSIDIVLIDTQIILKAFEIKIQYTLSYWDSLVVASALSRKCDILYSEDMHHGLIIENSLKIVNPFKEKA